MKNRIFFITKKIIYTISIIFLLFIILLFSLFIIGKYRFLSRKNSSFPDSVAEGERFYFNSSLLEDNIFSYKADTEVTIGGKTYVPNPDIYVLYFLGVDSDEPIKSKMPPNGGQADTHILVFINTKEEKIQFVTINRNTMTDIDIYDVNNVYGYTIPGQICLQHAYGDGMDESCKRSASLMERFLYDSPICGYFSLQKGAITAINDSVGGVRVTALEDVIFPEPETIIHKGDDVLLLGSNAYYYLTFRYIENFGSNNTRLERQRQYINCFVNQLHKSCQKNIFLPFEIYQNCKKYVTTDLSFSELIYLFYLSSSYTIETDVYSLPGTTVDGDPYECFYPDEDALCNMILKYYYIMQ